MTITAAGQWPKLRTLRSCPVKLHNPHLAAALPYERLVAPRVAVEIVHDRAGSGPPQFGRVKVAVEIGQRDADAVGGCDREADETAARSVKSAAAAQEAGHEAAALADALFQ